MNEARRERDVGDVAVRERLLAEATQLFARKGYASTTVREIVAAAGVTKPVLYYYFRNKEGIYLELMRAGFSKFDAILAATLTGGGGAVEKIRRLSCEVFQLFLDYIEVARVMYAIYYGPPQGAPFFDFDANHFKLRDGKVEDMTWAIIGAVNVAMEIELCHPEIGLGKEGLLRVLNVLFEGMSAAKGRRKGVRR